MTATADQDNGMSPAALQAAAEDAYEKSLHAGTPLRAPELAAQFGRGTRWGYDRIAAVKDRLNGSAVDLSVSHTSRPAVTLHAVKTDTPATTTPNPATDTPAPPVAKPGAVIERTAVHTPAAPVAKPGAKAPAKPAPAPAAKPAVRPTAPPVANPSATPGATEPTGTWWSYAGFIAGLVVSVSANVLHALQPGAGVPQLVGAAVWPIFLLVAIEVLSRTGWGESKRAKIFGIGGAGAVAIVAAVASYQHMRGLLIEWGEHWFLASIEPLAVDGLMILCGMAILANGKAKTNHG